MDAAHPLLTDPAAIVRSLDPDAIRNQLDANDRERQALLILLRVAMAARRKQRRAVGHEQEAGHE